MQQVVNEGKPITQCEGIREILLDIVLRAGYHNFIRPFIAFAMAKLDFAMICRDSLVTSGSACTSLSLFACSLSSRRMSSPSFADPGGRLSLHTATMLETMVMIWVRFSLRLGEGVGLRTADRTLWMA